MRILRWFWGILTILSCGFILWSFVFASGVYTNSVNDIQASGTENQDAQQAGAAIGTTIGLGIYLLCGVPVFLVSAFLYWRNGVGMQKKKDREDTERRHQEQLQAMQSQINQQKRE